MLWASIKPNIWCNKSQPFLNPPLPQWIRSENKCHFCIKLKFFNFFTIQLRELKFLPMNVLMSTSIFRKLQLSSLYSLIIILFSKIKRCNFLSGQFLSVWFRGIKIMKSMLSYFVQWSELNLFRVLLAPSSVLFFSFFVFDDGFLMKLGEVVVLMSSTTSPSFIKNTSKTKKLKKRTLDGAKSTLNKLSSDHWAK